MIKNITRVLYVPRQALSAYTLRYLLSQGIQYVDTIAQERFCVNHFFIYLRLIAAYAISLATFSFTPGPMVDAMVTLFK